MIKSFHPLTLGFGAPSGEGMRLRRSLRRGGSARSPRKASAWCGES